MSDAATLVKLALEKGVTVVTAESCTAGMLGAAITDIAGSSAVYDRGFITYSNAAKAEMLGVSQQTLTTFGAVSEKTALEMAKGALAHSHASTAISITGIAGPGPSEHKPEGMVCFGLANETGAMATTKQFGALGRENVRFESAQFAITLLIDALN